MKNFVIGVVTGILVAGLTALILFFALVRLAGSLGERRPEIADGSTVVLKLEGSVPERPPTEVPIPFLEDQSPATLAQVWDLLRSATTDSRVKAILFEPRGLTVGWAQLQEIHHDLEQFRRSGKPLVAYLHNPGTREYYLATAADRIYMSPEDTLNLKGLLLEATYLKGSLDKLGLQMEVIHAGKYKDAGDIFTRTSMTPETREVLNGVLDQFYGDLTATIAEGRKKQPADVRAIIDQGPFLGQAAVESGLVDELAFEDQAGDALKKRLNQGELKKVSHKTYLRAPAAPSGSAARNRIALIVGEGEIVSGSGPGGLGGDDGVIASERFSKLLQQVAGDSSIKGAIIRVDSPGGDGVASDDILHAAKSLSKAKPVVISMGDLAASGGYFISMTGDPIVAYPNTLTGSIGVIFGKLNLKGLLDKIGVQTEPLSRGRYAAIDSADHALTPDERQKLTDQIDAFYKAFVARVADGRKRPAGEIEGLAQGRVWLGAQAKQNGLVDSLGGLDSAIDKVKERAHIPASERITLVTYPPKRSLFEVLMSRADESAIVETKIRQVLGVPVSALARGGFLKILPYAITVR